MRKWRILWRLWYFSSRARIILQTIKRRDVKGWLLNCLSLRVPDRIEQGRMDLDLVGVLAGITGAVLVWASLKNKHPIQAVQLALSGGNPNDAGPFIAATDSPAGFTGEGGGSSAQPLEPDPAAPPVPWGTI
jgi:hypothetical protein